MYFNLRSYLALVNWDIDKTATKVANLRGYSDGQNIFPEGYLLGRV